MRPISILAACVAATAGFLVFVQVPAVVGSAAPPKKASASAGFDRAIAAHSQELLARGRDFPLRHAR
jgi:hypothetical protein